MDMLCDAGIVKLVQHSAGNGMPLGAEVNNKYRKYIYLDTGLMLRMTLYIQQKRNESAYIHFMHCQVLGILTGIKT